MIERSAFAIVFVFGFALSFGWPGLAAAQSIPTSTPDAVGIDGARLAAMEAKLAAERKHKLYSFLVLRHGKLAFEAYFNGRDRDTRHDIRSATKSVTSLLTGIALEQGAFGDGGLDDVDTPLMTPLKADHPEVDDKDSITLRHLLTMQSGLDCDDGDRKTRGQEDRMYKSKDWVAYFLNLDVVDPPGTRTRYCTGGVVALGAALAAATGHDVADFAQQHLFAPLGITNAEWERFDRDAQVDTGGHLHITTRGLATLGQLVLQDGRWQDQQLVSADWIATSTAAHTEMDSNPYGFLWWRNPVQYGTKRFEVISARGNGGQVIFIVPELGLVAAANAGHYNSEKAGLPYEIFYRVILPSVDDVAVHLPNPPAKK